MVSKFATVSRIALFAGALALGGGAALAQTTAGPVTAPTTSTTTAAPAPTAAAPAMTQAAPAAPKAEAGKVGPGKTDQKPAAAAAPAKKVEKHSSLHRRHQHIVKANAEKVDGSAAAAKSGNGKTAPAAATAGQKAETGKSDVKPGMVDAKKADGGKPTTTEKNAAPAGEGSSTKKL